ncbi:hypothetical protein OIU79_008489 [Salix purpurea]|uniref:Uncharacterized protein n=1 Tax=Salix purpurea TaxID=77065 RepID=A0A9Q0TIJ4_SALPP|nr:hypothetical protein OIU79_008489 [Salix purpurea]
MFVEIQFQASPNPAHAFSSRLSSGHVEVDLTGVRRRRFMETRRAQVGFKILAVNHEAGENGGLVLESID